MHSADLIEAVARKLHYLQEQERAESFDTKPETWESEAEWCRDDYRELAIAACNIFEDARATKGKESDDIDT